MYLCLTSLLPFTFSDAVCSTHHAVSAHAVLSSWNSLSHPQSFSFLKLLLCENFPPTPPHESSVSLSPRGPPPPRRPFLFTNSRVVTAHLALSPEAVTAYLALSPEAVLSAFMTRILCILTAYPRAQHHLLCSFFFSLKLPVTTRAEFTGRQRRQEG